MIKTDKTGGYHHGDLRQTLIGIGLDLIDRRGVDAINFRELARLSGVSPGAPYHHFENRDALLSAIAIGGFVELTKAMAAASAAASEGGAYVLEAIGRAYVHFALQNRGHFRVMFRGETHMKDSSELAQASQGAFQLLRKAVEQCQNEGVAPPGDSTTMTLMAWSMVHGLATLMVEDALPAKWRAPFSPETTALKLMTQMFESLSKQGSFKSIHLD